MALQKVVTPVKTGVQIISNCLKALDSGFRNDGISIIQIYYETIKFD